MRYDPFKDKKNIDSLVNCFKKLVKVRKKPQEKERAVMTFCI